MIAYETATYRAQRPIAYTNWPTLDPLEHVTETTVEAEISMRTALGERVERIPLEYDNDATGLDAMLVRPTARFPAGHFASYHAYPYYPDFMIMEAAYQSARSPYGRSNFFGYLEALKRHHAGMALVISEYGVPASLGIGHLQPQGWHHGGQTEAEMAAIDARLTAEIAAAGFAGGIVFAWIDEWFKKNWVTIEFQIPLERTRLWYNRLDAEQHYGMIAYEAKPPVAGETLAERLDAWRAVPTLYDTPAGVVRAAADAAYLWLLVDPAGPAAEAVLGFDMVLPQAGDRRLPGVPELLPVGVEFALELSAGQARVTVDSGYNPFQRVPLDGPGGRVTRELPPIEDPPAGLFHGRFEQQNWRPFRPLPNDDGRFEAMHVIVNRRRFTRDTTEILAAGYDRGILPAGEPPDGYWQRAPSGAWEVRIPWGLLNVTDPSARRVLLDTLTKGPFGTVVVEDIGVVGAWRAQGAGADAWRHWPARGGAEARFTWAAWQEPEYVARERPVYRAMRDVFAEIDAAARVSQPDARQ